MVAMLVGRERDGWMVALLMHIPLRPLGSYLPGPTPMATDGGRGQSCLGKVRSRLFAPAWITEMQQAGEAPRGCKGPAGALTRPPGPA